MCHGALALCQATIVAYFCKCGLCVRLIDGMPEKRFYDWRGQRHVRKSRSAVFAGLPVKRFSIGAANGMFQNRALRRPLRRTASDVRKYSLRPARLRWHPHIIDSSMPSSTPAGCISATPVALLASSQHVSSDGGAPLVAVGSVSILADASGGTEECMYYPGAKKPGRCRRANHKNTM